MENNTNGYELRNRLERYIFYNYPAKTMNEIAEHMGVSREQVNNSITTMRTRGIDITYFHNRKHYKPLVERHAFKTGKETLMTTKRPILVESLLLLRAENKQKDAMIERQNKIIKNKDEIINRLLKEKGVLNE